MARNLNNQLRTEMAIKLALKAVNKHGAGLGRLAKHLTDLQRQEYVDRLARLEPEIQPQKWTDLIQKRLAVGYGGLETLEEYVPAEGDGKAARWSGVRLHLFTFSSNRKAEIQRRELLHRFIGELRQVSGFSSSFDMLGRYELTRNTGCWLEAIHKPQPDLPAMPSANKLNPLHGRLEKAIISDTRAFLARFGRVITSGFAYLEECLDLLQSCKTEKQLLDLFPEAAKLLPPEVKKTTAMVPVEQAQKLRKMLETGVPED